MVYFTHSWCSGRLDKIIMLIALIVYRIGWWATIYCQQPVGILTIFGPIQWAISLLPKWGGAWAKWLIRYLTVHFCELCCTSLDSMYCSI